MSLETLSPVTGRATLELRANGALLLAPDLFWFDTGAAVDSIETGRVWTLRLLAASPAVYERVMVALLLSPDRAVELRWGFDQGSRVLWHPWENFRILSSTPELETNVGNRRGYPFELVLGGVFFTMDLVQRVRGWAGKVSDLVQELAEAYGLEPVVEPTQAQVNLVQSFETDLHFLQDRLLGAALNTNGLAGYYCYAEQGRLHFHTRGWQQAPLLLPHNAGPAGSGFLLTRDEAQTQARLGGQSARLVTYDPLTDTTEVVDADPKRYTRFGQRLSGATGQVLRGTHVGPNLREWAAARLQAQYSSKRDRFERLTFALPNAFAARVGLVLILQLPDPTAAANGPYHVERVEWTLQGGNAQAVITATRGELAGRPSEARVQPAETAAEALPVVAAAPGVDPAFYLASASTLGSGVAVPVQPGG